LDAAGVPALQGARASLLALKRLFDNRPATQLEKAAAGLRPNAQWWERLATGTAFSEREAKDFLRAHGVKVPREVLATTGPEAVAAAATFSSSVALKIESSERSHKTEVGGVKLGLRNGDEVAAGFAAIMADVSARAPQARIHGVSVQEMVVGGIEVIVGLSQTDPFGTAVTIG